MYFTAAFCLGRSYFLAKKIYSKPLLSICPPDYQWKNIDEKMERGKLDDKVWKWSLRLSSEYLLHIETEKKLSPDEHDFVELVANLLRLRLQYINHAGADAKNDDNHITRAGLKNDYPEIIGSSRSLVKILQMIDKVAGTDVSILIQGESGTGKELIAKAIHKYSPRSSFPYVSENCAAIPETLLESELFGYSKGAFTGAFQNKKGLFEIANQGTLFWTR